MNRDMAVPPSSTFYASTTSSDNNTEQSCLSSLESFLFLPQLPVNGDDGVDEDAYFSRRHYPRQYDMQQEEKRSQQLQQQSSSLLPITSTSAPPVPLKSSSLSGCNNNPLTHPDYYENGDHKNSCQQYSSQSVALAETDSSYTTTTTTTASRIFYDNGSNNTDHVCGGKSSFPSNSSFSFIAVNDTVIGSPSSPNSNSADESDAKIAAINNKSGKRQKHQHSSSSTSIFIKGNPPNRNSSNNYNNSPFCFAANQQHSHLHRYPHQNHRHHCSRRRFLIIRVCQAFSLLIFTAFLLNLVKSSIWWTKDYENRLDLFAPPTSFSSSRLQHRLVQSWNMPSILPSSALSSAPTVFKIPQILSNFTGTNSNNNNDESNNQKKLVLLDVPNFRFLINNKTKCSVPRDHDNYVDGADDGPTNNGKGANTTIFFMIIVHSAPHNFQERQAIRETWGSLQRLGQFHIRLVFLLGQDSPSQQYKSEGNSKRSNNGIGNDDGDDDKQDKKFYGKYHSTFHSKIQEESQQYGDIVAGSFHDSYHNLTYKHLSGYLWVINHCPQAKFILKADDDAFIDIFQLFKFVIRTFGENPEAALICNVFPEGTKPVRGTDTHGKKWAVTYEEYPYEFYPKYCGGLAYLATPNVIREIYRMSGRVQNKYLWIDDVYVTGILRELAHVEPFYLNLRYSYEPEEYRKWLHSTDNDHARNNNDEEERGDARVSYEMEEGSTPSVTAAAMVSNKMKNERGQPTPPRNLPFMIVHLERGPQLGREMRELWNKTWDVWSQSGLGV